MQMSLCRAEAKGKCFLWASASANTVPGLSSYLGTIILGVFSPIKHEILILYIDAQSVSFHSFKQQCYCLVPWRTVVPSVGGTACWPALLHPQTGYRVRLSGAPVSNVGSYFACQPGQISGQKSITSLPL